LRVSCRTCDDRDVGFDIDPSKRGPRPQPSASSGLSLQTKSRLLAIGFFVLRALK